MAAAQSFGPGKLKNGRFPPTPWRDVYQRMRSLPNTGRVTNNTSPTATAANRKDRLCAEPAECHAARARRRDPLTTRQASGKAAALYERPRLATAAVAAIPQVTTTAPYTAETTRRAPRPGPWSPPPSSQSVAIIATPPRMAAGTSQRSNSNTRRRCRPGTRRASACRCAYSSPAAGSSTAPTRTSRYGGSSAGQIPWLASSTPNASPNSTTEAHRAAGLTHPSAESAPVPSSGSVRGAVISQTARRLNSAVRVPTTPGHWGFCPIGRWSSGTAQSFGPGTFSAGRVPPKSPLKGCTRTDEVA